MSGERHAGRSRNSALQSALRPGTIAGALIASLLVGTILTVIYQGEDIINGRFSSAMLARILVTYLVPYAVYTLFAGLVDRRAEPPAPDSSPPAAAAPSAPIRPATRVGVQAAAPTPRAPRPAHAAAPALPQRSSGLSLVGEIAFIAGPRRGQTFPVRSSGTIIGREEDADIILDDPLVSRHHVRVSSRGGGYYLEDLGSRNGTSVNGEAMMGSMPLTDGDSVQVGDSTFEFCLRPAEPALLDLAALPERAMASKALFVPPPPPGAVARLERLAGMTASPSYQLTRPVTTIGRGSDNDIVLQDNLASRRHARILHHDGAFYVDDLGSANGVSVNGQRVDGTQRLGPGDELTVGGVRFRFLSDAAG